MEKDYKEPFELEKTIGEMMVEIMHLKAQVNAQSAIIELLFSQGQPLFPKEQYPEFYHRLVSRSLSDLVTSHSWYEGFWKYQLDDLLSPPDK